LGKPYQSEVSNLAKTFEWARSQCVEELAKSFREITGLPLIIVGSGGSLAACHFTAQLRQEFSGTLARAMTPLEFVQASSTIRNTAVMIISAGGRNPDIIDAFRSAVLAELPRILIVGGRSTGPLITMARNCPRADVHVFPVPTGKDGFLATNSLLAFFVILYRAQREALSTRDRDSVIPFQAPTSSSLAEVETLSRKLWTREHLVVLYGPSLLSVGMDIESRFAEAALGSVQVADFRNFAHGRHYWLAKRGKETGVLALVSQRDRDLAQRTLALIPPDIPCVRVDFPGEDLAVAIGGIWTGIYIAGFAGMARGIDPGRPKVPLFGRKLYHLKRMSGRAKMPIRSSEDLFISRKIGQKNAVPIVDRTRKEWSEALTKFKERLLMSRYGAVVCDYDETLCDRRDRFRGVSPEISQELVRIVRAGLLLGVATGRGKSVRAELRKAIPRQFWSRVIVGYYNGGDVAPLADDKRPCITVPLSETLQMIARALQADLLISRTCTLTVRPGQISVESDHSSREEIWKRACEIASSHHSLTVLSSGHSIDVLDDGVSKLNVVAEVRLHVVGSAGEILCIGDRGGWPGNDYQLLATPYSLSVDQTSRDPDTCWNLAPAGSSGTEATLYYLRQLQPSSKKTFKLTAL